MLGPRGRRSRKIPRTLAVDFVNTVACGACRAGDALGTPKEFVRWARGRLDLPSPQLSTRELARLRSLRTALLALFGSAVRRKAPPSGGVARLNAASSSFIPRVVAWERGRWILRSTAEFQSPLERIEGGVVRSATDVLVGPDLSKLRRCKGPGCAHFILARTRTQIWCSSSGCGNRARVSRHYWRERAASSVHR